MIKRLKIQFILIAMVSVSLIFLLLLSVVNIFMQKNNEFRVHRQMKQIAQCDGEIQIIGDRENRENNKASQQKSEEAPGRFPFEDRASLNRCFSVRVDHEGNLLALIEPGPAHISEKEAIELAAQAQGKGQFGSLGEYRFYAEEKPYGTIVVFMDYTIENKMLSNLNHICLLIGGIGVAVLFIVVVVLSHWFVKPVQVAFEKQRQFISDAGHELKTPLTVISANADVLGNVYGGNKWLKYIQSDVERMSVLVNELLTLTRIEQPEMPKQHGEFDLSRALLEVVLPFESTAFEAGKHMEMDLEERVSYHGDASQIKRLITILVDNAIKYSDPGGMVRISLKTHNAKRVIRVYNTGPGIPETERDKVFERFYRGDAAHSREKDGYGLGLAIAKSIVDAHKGQIVLEGVEGQWVAFQVTLSIFIK